jgi:predicted trehalose synthase
MPTKEQRKEQKKKYYERKKQKIESHVEEVPDDTPLTVEIVEPVKVIESVIIIDEPVKVIEPVIEDVQPDIQPEGTITEEEYEQIIELLAEKEIRESIKTDDVVKEVESKPNFFLP